MAELVPPTTDDPTPVPVDPTPTPPPEEPTPAPQSHNPYLLRQAVELGVSQDEITAYSSDELQQAVYHRTRALQAFRQAQTPVVTTNAPVAPVPPDEPDLGLTPEEQAELQELNPVLAKALRANARAAHEAKRAAAEQTENFRRQQTQGELARQVNAAMDAKHAKALGVGTSAEAARKNAVLVELARIAQQGVITDQTPPEFAVAIAVKNLFGESAPASASPPALRPGLAPTPTARPTSRHGGGEEGDVNTIEDLAAIWEKKFREREVEESASKNKNGSFRP